ncbi:MAG: sensor domain-containing protein [Mycobacterium sp.]
MKRRAVGVFALALTLAGCSTNAPAATPTPKLVSGGPAVEAVLLSPNAVNQAMGTAGMITHPPASQMGDHRDLLPNLNCLGVWQVDEVGVYGSSDWGAMRQVMMRSPDTEQWDDLAVQSVVAYHSVDGARKFFTESADRWSKCTNHHVNITLNGIKLPRWTSGELTKTVDRLAIPVTRGSDAQTRSCQRVLSIAVNVIIDVQACKPPRPAPVTQAAAIADQIEAALPK